MTAPSGNSSTSSASAPPAAARPSHVVAAPALSIEKLDGPTNFHTWKFTMQNILTLEGLWETITGIDKDVQNDRRTLARICLALKPSLYQYVRSAKTAAEAWNNLAKIFEDKGLYRRVLLLRRLHKIQFSEFESMSAYIEEVTTLVHQLLDIGKCIEDAEVAEILLSGLSPEYDTVVSSMAAVTATSELSSDVVKTRLLQEYSRKTSNVSGSAFVMRKSNVNANLVCNYCGKKGHVKARCFKLKREKKIQKAATAMVEEQQTNLVSAFLTLPDNNFYLDSGASNHMVRSKDLFTNMEPDNTIIKVANNQIVTSQGIGQIKLTINNQVSPLLLSNVLYVPNLSNNLISISKLVQKDYSVEFNDKGCSIYNNGQTTGNPIACVECVNGLYKLCVCVGVNINKPSPKEHSLFLDSQESPSVAVAANLPAQLWHRRLGHLSVKGMKQLRDGACGGVSFQDEENLESCKACLQGKMSAASYPSRSAHRATEPLQLIHSDVCGPMPEPSWGGARFLVTFTDDYTRKTYGYLMKEKSEVINHFITFKSHVEKQLGLRIKALRTDNGGEYFSNKFSEYLKREGIVHQSTVPYCPQQNGVSERLNRTLMDKVRCMLAESKLCNRYWGEAVMTAIYLKNRSPTVALEGRMPEQVWSSSPVDLTHLRVFGCIAYHLVPSQKRRKLDAKARMAIFVGYSETCKGYRLSEPLSPQNVIISRSVAFLENKYYENVPVSDCDNNSDNYYLNIINENVNNNNNSNDNNTLINDNNDNILNDDNVTINNSNQDISRTSGSVNAEVENTTSDSSDSDADEHYESMTSGQSSDEGEEVHEEPVTRVSTRPVRIKRAPQRYGDYDFSLLSEHALCEEPKSYEEAMASPHREDWLAAMRSEYNSLMENQVWKLVPRPTNTNIVKCKWVYKLKHDADGKFDRFKARLVARGFTQKQGIDYTETFSPVVRHSSMRILFALANEMDLEIDHIDVTTAFLNGNLNEVIYMEQPIGFCNNNNTNQVYLLQKSLYGLKQASKMWNEKLHNVLIENNFKQSLCEPCIYTQKIENDYVIISVYVDDCYFFHSKNSLIKKQLLNVLQNQFNIKNLGSLRNCLGMRVTRDRKKGILCLDQTEYIKKLLRRFNMETCKPVSTPMVLNCKLIKNNDVNVHLNDESYNYRQLMGSLMYLSVCTRPDISFSCSQLSQFNNCFDKSHWTAAKRILRYLAGTINNSLCFIKSGNLSLAGYTDADWGNDVNDRKSYTGFVVKLGKSTVNWESRKQRCVALSSTEAEYLAIGDICKDLSFTKNLLSELITEEVSCIVYNYNQSALKLLECKEFCHKRTKHIDIRFHFVKDLIKNKSISVKYLSTDKMIADVMTKPLCKDKHCRFISDMNVLTPDVHVPNGNYIMKSS